jgi:hypothetical protein
MEEMGESDGGPDGMRDAYLYFRRKYRGEKITEKTVHVSWMHRINGR